jgi:hypothetical protein
MTQLKYFYLLSCLLQVFILLLAYFLDEVFIYKYYWLFFKTYYIMPSTLSIQDLVVPINVASTKITLIVRISSSPFMVYGEKPEKFN